MGPILRGRFASKAAAVLTGFTFLFINTQATPARDNPNRVGTALVLCMDSSSSIDADEYALQRDGTAEAFLDAEVQSKILAAGMLVKVIEFDENALTRFDWTVLRTRADIVNFATRLKQMPRMLDGGTHVDACMNTAIGTYEHMPMRAENYVLDVSGDEFSSSGPGTITAANKKAKALGIRINGLPIAGKEEYPGANVQLIGGYDMFVRTDDGFIEIARGFADFKRAMTKKLQTEIAGMPLTYYAALANPRP